LKGLIFALQPFKSKLPQLTFDIDEQSSITDEKMI